MNDKYNTTEHSIRLAIEGGRINRKCKNKNEVMELGKSEGITLNMNMTKNQMIRELIFHRWDNENII